MAYKNSFSNLHKLYYVPKRHPLNEGFGKHLPAAYRKYVDELNQKPSAVHHIPPKEKYRRDPVTGVVTRLQDDPPPILYPKSFQKGLWGGAGILKGFAHPRVKEEEIPWYWVPKFETSVVYSEVLDIFITTVVTKRTIQLIHKHKGFDHYLLQTPACDLRSDLALKIKRNILLALDKKELPHTDPEKREQVYNSFRHYLQKYDSEYIQWYGLKIHEAIHKMLDEQEKAKGDPQPLKHFYRQQFIQELKEEASRKVEEEPSTSSTLTSILGRFNPFKRKST